MNKKYLSALLFGAMTLASTGTFTSCKDYDDDIENLQEQLNKKTSQEELTSKTAELQKSVEAAKAAANEALAKAKEALAKPSESGLSKAEVEKMIKEATKELASLEKLNQAIIDLKAELEGTYASQEALNILQKQFDSLQKTFDELTATLSAMVFVPQFYYQGIEAMKAATYKYNALGLKKVDANGDYAKDAPTAEADETFYTPGLVADYHLNPSNITEEAVPVEKLSFIAKDKNYTRAGGVVQPEIYGRSVKNGILTVKARLTKGEIKDIERDGKVTVLALQAATTKEGVEDTITSDYAAVKRVDIQNIALANAKSEAAHKPHLYTTAQEAIDNDAMIEVVWNDKDGVDLAEWVQTHYAFEEDLTTGVDREWDENANSGTVEKEGFEYKYELVGYHEGANKTSESAHAAFNPEDASVLRPQITKDGKQQGWNAEQSQATIGRQPLVRVSLYDTVSKKTVAVGYIKLEIVEGEVKAPENQVTVIAPFGFNDGYTLNCSEDALVHKLSWHQVEEKIIAVLKTSKEKFEKEYKLEGFVKNSTPADQFDETTKEAVAIVDPVGKVVITTDDTEATQTEVIKWTVEANEAYEGFLKNKTLGAIVRFAKVNSNGTHHYVYVTLNWAPSPLNVDPRGAIENSNKIAELWFSKYNKESKTGFDEVHLNVRVPQNPGEASDKCTFEKQLEQLFVGEKVAISKIDAVYKDYQEADLVKSFEFIEPDVKEAMGVSGIKYTLSASEDGSQFLASCVEEGILPTAIAEIVGNKVVYQENEVAKDVLNYADHSELAAKETLTGKVQIVAEGCKDYVLPLENDKFDVRFLRPITIGDKKNDGLKDAENAGDEIALAEVLTFKDWREQAFSPAGYNYFEYYGVKAITADVTKITTDLNHGTLGKTILKEVYPSVDIEFTAASGDITLDNMGVLNYKNNGAVLGAKFNISVPVTVEYRWGTIKKDVIIVVNPTIAQ